MSEAAQKHSLDHGRRFRRAGKRAFAGSRLFKKLPIAIFFAALTAAVSLTPVVRQIEDRFGLGLLFTIRGPVPAPEGAIIAAIDKQSLDWLRRIPTTGDSANVPLVSCLPANAALELERLKGPSSLPRPVYACLLRELRRLGFPVVAFDILFSVPGLAADDKMLAREMRSHGATVILSGYERFAIEKAGARLVVEQNRQPLPLFQESAAGVGSFLVPRTETFAHGYLAQAEELDGAVTLSDAVLSLFRPAQSAPEPRQKRETQFKYFWLYGAPGAIKTVPIRDILSGATPNDVVRTAANTAVFVGACDPSMADFQDSFPSLFRNASDANISGVELVATAFLNSRDGHHLRTLPSLLELAVLFGFILALSAVAMLAGPRSVGMIAGLAIGYFITAVILFSQYRLYLPIIAPVFAIVPMLAILAVVLRSRTAMALIMRLAPAPLARRMLADSSGDRNAVVTSDATVAFFDIIDSTKIGEGLGNLAFAALMNDFHDTVTREVEKHGGYVIAFAGDGMTALFDGSDAGSDHALLACRSAVSSLHKIRALNLQNQKRGIPGIGVRVGMNSGLIAEGSIGAQDRFNFAVVGDAVNIAARLEKLGKTLFPGEQEVILFAEATHQRVEGRELSFIDCGPQQLPGRHQPENVFRLLAD